MNTTIPAIKQSEAAQILGIAPADMKAFRNANLKDGEWWKDGVPIVWSREAFERIQQDRAESDRKFRDGCKAMVKNVETDFGTVTMIASHNAQTPVDRPPFDDLRKQTTLAVRAIKASRNTRFLYADLNGERISVKCHPRKRDALIGKTIRVSVETTEGQTTYTHEP